MSKMSDLGIVLIMGLGILIHSLKGGHVQQLRDEGKSN